MQSHSPTYGMQCRNPLLYVAHSALRRIGKPNNIRRLTEGLGTKSSLHNHKLQ